MEFAEQLQAEKDRLGYSIAELSEALETSPRTIQHWMNGDRVPSQVTQEGTLARLKRYKIVRYFFDDIPQRTIASGLTLKEAQKHCQDPETASDTCVTVEKRALTKRVGKWFDGYTEE